MYTDNSLEFDKACEDLSWNRRTSIPHRSGTQRNAERAVCRVKEGTSAVLLQSSLDDNWWTDSMECDSYVRKVQDLLSEEKRNSIRETFWRTIHKTDYSIWFIGWTSLYNCEGSVKNPSIWKESLTWIVPRICFVRGWICCGDMLVADVEELQTMDASENYSKILNAKEGDISRRNGKKFQPQMDESKPLEIKIWEHPPWDGIDQFKEAVTLISWRIRRVSSTTSRLISGCQWSDEWLLVHVMKLYIPPSRWTQSETLLVERRIIPLTNFDVKQEKRIDDHRNIDGSQDLWDPLKLLILIN